MDQKIQALMKISEGLADLATALANSQGSIWIDESAPVEDAAWEKDAAQMEAEITTGANVDPGPAQTLPAFEGIQTQAQFARQVVELASTMSSDDINEVFNSLSITKLSEVQPELRQQLIAALEQKVNPLADVHPINPGVPNQQPDPIQQQDQGLWPWKTQNQNTQV